MNLCNLRLVLEVGAVGAGSKDDADLTAWVFVGGRQESSDGVIDERVDCNGEVLSVDAVLKDLDHILSNHVLATET